MKKFITNFKPKYLLLLVIPFAAFIFTKVTATGNITVTTVEEFQSVVNKTYLTEKQDFTIYLTIRSQSSFSNQTAEKYCEQAIEGIREMGAFYAAGLSCDAALGTGGGAVALKMQIVSIPLKVHYYDKIMDFVETEGTKMYAQTKDKEQLIKLVSNKMHEMLKGQHDFFFNEDSPLYYNRKSGYNLLASLLYDYFDIENKIIRGKERSYDAYWNLVKLGDNWYHIENIPEYGIYLSSDSVASKTFTWDNGAYPKAPNSYVTSSIKETTVIVPIPKPEDIEIPGETGTIVQPVTNTGNASTWAEPVIKEAINSGIVPSRLQGRYLSAITREEFCELAVKLYEKLSGTTASQVPNPFNDTMNVEVIKAFNLGIVNGVGNGRFAPTNLITREQIAVMFFNLLNALGENTSIDISDISFADDAEMSSWAKEEVLTLSKLDIISGVGSNRFNPKGNATIEQAIALANRLYNQYK